MTAHLLIVDDDPDVISALSYLLQTEQYEVTTARTPAQALNLLKTTEFSLMVADLNYSKDTTSGKEGLELLDAVQQVDESLPVVVMTAWGSVETAVAAMQKGARDFVQKPWENERLLSIVGNQILLRSAQRKSARLTEENQILRGQLGINDGRLFAHSKPMLEFLEQINQVAKSDADILLTGENGTGKSHLAKHIHQHSARHDQPLISVNMGSITATLFESEMFGHVKGAFTGAVENRLGRFELADNGTLFLDEIGNTPYEQQSKLLRVLEDRQFEKVGSSRTQHTDCRLISATNSNLDDAVAEQRFRQDLLYRINTVTLHVPPLRARSEDIVPLAQHFLDECRSKYNRPDVQLTDTGRRALLEYDWPGNIRELSHAMQRAVLLCTSHEITPSDLGIQSVPARTIETLDDVQKDAITQRLAAFEGDSQKAARSLGMSKSAFYRHVKKYEL